MIPGNAGTMTGRRGGASSGTQTFTSAGTFNVPEYTTLSVTIKGYNGSNAAGVPPCASGILSGGLGGVASRSWSTGGAGAPTPGGTVSITYSTAGGGWIYFNTGTVLGAQNGTNAYGGATDGGSDPICTSSASVGNPGGVTGNTGGSAGTSDGAGGVYITWS